MNRMFDEINNGHAASDSKIRKRSTHRAPPAPVPHLPQNMQKGTNLHQIRKESDQFKKISGMRNVARSINS